MKTKNFKSIQGSIPGVDSVVDSILKDYFKEKELRERNPKYASRERKDYWKKIVLSKCPDSFKNDQGEWLGFVKTYLSIRKKARNLHMTIENFLESQNQTSLNF